MYSQVRTQTEVTTLFEYESINISDGYELKCLEQLSKQTGIEVFKPIVRNEQLQFQARQYVGVLRLGRRTIQILPKIHRAHHQEQRYQEASRNLLFMLNYARYLGIREVNLVVLEKHYAGE